MIKKNACRIIVLLLLFLPGFNLSGAQEQAPRWNAKTISFRHWNRMAKDVADQVYAYVSENKDLRLKPIHIDLKEGGPMENAFVGPLKGYLKQYGMILNTQHRDALTLSCHIAAPQPLLNDADLMALEKIQLEDAVSVLRGVADRFLTNDNAGKNNLINSAMPASPTHRPADVLVFVETALTYSNHTFIKNTDAYQIRLPESTVEMHSPVYKEPPPEEEKVKKRGRTFHVVD
jgi:hypothetical protein